MRINGSRADEGPRPALLPAKPRGARPPPSPALPRPAIGARILHPAPSTLNVDEAVERAPAEADPVASALRAEVEADVIASEPWRRGPCFGRAGRRSTIRRWSHEAFRHEAPLQHLPRQPRVEEDRVLGRGRVPAHDIH